MFQAVCIATQLKKKHTHKQTFYQVNCIRKGFPSKFLAPLCRIFCKTKTVYRIINIYLYCCIHFFIYIHLHSRITNRKNHHQLLSILQSDRLRRPFIHVQLPQCIEIISCTNHHLTPYFLYSCAHYYFSQNTAAAMERLVIECRCIML